MKTLADLSRSYYDHLRSIRISPETLRKTREKVSHFTSWLSRTAGIVTADDLRPGHLVAWHRHLAGIRTVKGHPLKARSINFYIVKIRGFIGYLAKNGYVQSGLLSALPFVKEPLRLPGNVLAHARMKKFLSGIATDSPAGQRDRAMFELLYSTGIRIGELLTLDVEHIDFTHRTAQVTGKGDKQRIVPIGRTALRYLASYIRAVRPYLLKSPLEKALFVNQAGRRLTYGNFRLILKAVSGRLKPEETVTAHTFRRSCTTELIRGGANMYHVKELLGHESLDTLKFYTRLTILDLKKTHEKCHPREKDEK